MGLDYWEGISPLSASEAGVFFEKYFINGIKALKKIIF